jgi:predicted deacetylase
MEAGKPCPEWRTNNIGVGTMIPKPAQYLLRFDDLCPTMAHGRWQRFLPLIEEFHLRPILAVIPDNQDAELDLSPPDPEFWARMRAMEAVGATIALHGLHHHCGSRGKSLLPLHLHTEFSGVPEETQREWIREGLRILRGHGLNPKIFVAPRHGFDHATLRALRNEGIEMLSDGFARVPFIRGGITWIPQQLWRPVEKNKGLWTICVHSNFANAAQVAQLHEFLSEHAAQFTSVERAVAELFPGGLSLIERFHETFALWRTRAGKVRRLWKLISRFRGRG